MLVVRARSGDPDAFSALMEEYRSTVRGLVARFVHDADDASDIEQETWIRAASSLHSLREPGRFRPWVKSIARHASLNFLASRKRRTARVSTFEECGTEDFEDPGATPEHHLISRDNQRKVWETLGSLSERDRTALYLREYRDLSYEKIADRLGISRGAAEVCVFRARERFRRLFTEIDDHRPACGLDPLRLSTLVDGEGDAEARDALAAHLRTCEDCETRLTTMRAGQALYRNLAAIGVPIALPTGLPSVGTLVGKLLAMLGVGGGSAATATAIGGAAGGGAAASGGASILAPVLSGAAAAVITAVSMTPGFTPDRDYGHDPGPVLPSWQTQATQEPTVAPRPLAASSPAAPAPQESPSTTSLPVVPPDRPESTAWLATVVRAMNAPSEGAVVQAQTAAKLVDVVREMNTQPPPTVEQVEMTAKLAAAVKAMNNPPVRSAEAPQADEELARAVHAMNTRPRRAAEQAEVASWLQAVVRAMNGPDAAPNVAAPEDAASDDGAVDDGDWDDGDRDDGASDESASTAGDEDSEG